jgi:hypothetical protein
MSKTIRLALCLLLAGTATQLIAQPAGRAIVNQPIEWFSATANLKVHKRITWVLDAQIRFAESFDPMQNQARTALDFKVNDHFSIIPLGYVYTWNYLYGKQPNAYRNNEHRIWQQFFYKHSISKLKIDHRVRIEERMIQVHSKDQDNVVHDDGYTNHQVRFRYRFMARLPLNHAALDPKTLFASAYDEVFLSTGKLVTFHEPDQNRIFAGLGYQFTKDFALQGGFLYQLMIKSNGTKQENNVGFQVLLGYNIDLTKKAK